MMPNLKSVTPFGHQIHFATTGSSTLAATWP